MKKSWIENLIAWIGTPSSLVAHSVFFAGIFILRKFGYSSSDILLTLTTIVSLEAIYLSIFIQMSVNKQILEQEKTRDVISNIQETIEDVHDTIEETIEEEKS